MRTMRQRIWVSGALSVAVLAAAFLAGAALARSDAAPPTKSKGVFTAAISLGNPGFSEGNLSNPTGFSADIARGVAKAMGLRIRFVEYPFGELFVPGSKPY